MCFALAPIAGTEPDPAALAACRHSRSLTPLPQRPSLRSGLCCPSPSSLNRPHAPHSQARPDFAVRRFIQNAFAVRERLGDPRVVPCFRQLLFSDMSSSMSPEDPVAAYIQYLHHQHRPSHKGGNCSASSVTHKSASCGGPFRGVLVR
jgi:hypothetical protein